MLSKRRFHIILLMHGSHGSSKDWRYLASCLSPDAVGVPRIASSRRERVVLVPDVLSGFRTDRGLVACSDVLYAYLNTQLNALLRQPSPDALHGADCAMRTDAAQHMACGDDEGPQVVLSCVGHSFGGLVARRAVARVLDAYAPEQITEPGCSSGSRPVVGGMCCYIGSPLCGVATMPSAVMRWIGTTIGRCASQTYADMFLLNNTFAADAAQAAGRFQHTWMISDCRDALVPMESSSLLPSELAWAMRQGVAPSHRASMDHETEAAILDRFQLRASTDLGQEESHASLPLLFPRASRSFDLFCDEATTERVMREMPSSPFDDGQVRPMCLALTDALRLLRLKQFAAASPSRSTSHRWQGAQVQSTIVDLLQGVSDITMSMSDLTPPASVRVGAKRASHRALICKDPLHVPQYYGHVCDAIAQRLMLFD